MSSRAALWHSAAMDIPGLYAELITAIGDGTGMADSLLHVHAGMAVLFLARIVTRRSLASPIPLAVVALAELANEVLDRLHYGSWRWSDTLLDVVNTLFWPTVLMVGLRLRKPHLLDAQPLRRDTIVEYEASRPVTPRL